MSAPTTKSYHVRGSFFQPRAHHAGIKALWETKWRQPASQGIYPFVDGKVEDFDPVFKAMSDANLHEPYNPDEYASFFFPAALALEDAAAKAYTAKDFITGRDLDLRAAALYRIARFPIVRSPKTEEAWVRGKAAYLRASPYLSPPNTEVQIPHTHGIDTEVGSMIPAYLRLPADASTKPVPVLLFICGLDAYRTDHSNRTEAHARHGFATLSVEIPGTGDAPGLPNDPLAADRMWSSVLDWIATQPGLDANCVCARGVSTGGYYAMRIAHTHAERLKDVVAQGGGSHGMFAPEWIAAQNKMEYPFALADALAWKFGYGEDMEKYSRESKARFSLLETGIFDMKSCRLLLINGVEDEIFPIEDSELPLKHGSIKDARFVECRFHMGNPEAEPMIYKWLDQFH